MHTFVRGWVPLFHMLYSCLPCIFSLLFVFLSASSDTGALWNLVGHASFAYAVFVSAINLVYVLFLSASTATGVLSIGHASFAHCVQVGNPFSCSCCFHLISFMTASRVAILGQALFAYTIQDEVFSPEKFEISCAYEFTAGERSLSPYCSVSCYLHTSPRPYFKVHRPALCH